MLPRLRKKFVLAALAVGVVVISVAPTAEAGWRRRAVRRAYYAPVVVARPVVYSRHYVRPYHGVRVGYGGVSVSAPGVGVWVGY